MILTAYYHREKDAVVLELRGEDTGIPDVVMDGPEANGLLHELQRALWQRREFKKLSGNSPETGPLVGSVSGN